jgi:hypothetical protein
MRRNSMEGIANDVFSTIGHPQDNKNKSSKERFKSIGRYKYPKKYTKK